MSAPAPPPEAPPSGCSPFDVVCKAKEGAAEAVAAGASDAITDMATAVAEALGKTLTTLGTVWVTTATPDLTEGGASATVQLLQDSLWFYMAGFAVLAVIVGGARMAWEQRAEPGRELLRSLLTLTVVAGAGVTGIGLATTAADGFAEWILERSTTGTNFGANIVSLLALDAQVGAGLGPLLVIILGLCAIFASFVQIMLMVARAAMLVILAGILPLTASATNTELGRTWLRKAMAWTLAFIAYKPAAAVVYATAFSLSGTEVFGDDGSGLMNVLVGLVLMVLALFALPALMRFVTPVVSSMTSGSGGGGLGAAAAAAVPTGAIAVGARSARSRSEGGPIPTQTGGPGAPGSSGAGSSGAGGRPGPGGPTGPASAAAASRAATTGAAGSAGSTAAAVGGPASTAAAAAAAGTAKAAKAGTGAVRRTADHTANTEEGPRGSS